MKNQKEQTLIRRKDFMYGQVKRIYVPSKLYLFMRKDGLNSIVELLNKYSWHNIVHLASLTENEAAEFMTKLYEFGVNEFIRDSDEQDLVEVKKYTLERGVIYHYLKCVRSYYFYSWDIAERHEQFFDKIHTKLKKADFIFGYEKIVTETARISFAFSIIGSNGYSPKQAEILTEVLFELYFEGYFIF